MPAGFPHSTGQSDAKAGLTRNMPTSPLSESARLRLSVARAPWLWVALAAAAALRGYALYRFGPLMQPDSEDYLAFARTILSGGDWFWFGSVEGVTAFRMIGYPAVIAAAKLIAGELFDVLIVVLQSALSLVAMAQLYRVGRALAVPGWAAAFAAAAYGCGVIAVFDLNILTDGLFASLLVIVVCQLAISILEHRADRPIPILLCGALLAASVLVRDATLFASPLFALGAFGWGYVEGKSWQRGLRAAVTFLLPVAIVSAAYVGWNQYRTGDRFLTTGSQYALLMAPVMLEQNGIVVLREPVLREAHATTAPLADGPFFDRVLEMGRWLHKEKGLGAVERGRLAMAAYLTAWREAPFPMASQVLREYRGNQFLLLINFAHPWRELKGLSGQETNPGYRVFFAKLIADPSSKNLAVLIAELLSLALSGLVFASFVGCGVFALWRMANGARDPETIVLAWFIVLHAGFVGMYAMVHLEARYTIAMQALALVGGIAVISRAVTQMTRSRPAVPGS